MAQGGFGAATNFERWPTRLDSVAVGDFNGDGKQDLAVANVDSNNVSILLGNGAGSFSVRHQLRRWEQSCLGSRWVISTAMASKTWPLPTIDSTTCRSCWATVPAVLAPPPTWALALSLFSSGGRFQRRWQARPRCCQQRLGQCVDFAARLCADTDTDTDTHRHHTNAYTHRDTDTDPNPNAYTHRDTDPDAHSNPDSNINPAADTVQHRHGHRQRFGQSK